MAAGKDAFLFGQASAYGGYVGFAENSVGFWIFNQFEIGEDTQFAH